MLLFVGILGESAAAFQSGEFEKINGLSITVIHKDKSEWKGYSIICSETHCAFLVYEKKVEQVVEPVKVWAVADISVIQSTPGRKAPYLPGVRAVRDILAWIKS